MLGLKILNLAIISMSRHYIDEPPLIAAQNYFGKQESNLEILLAKKAQNINQNEFNQVFFIVAESMSSWHFSEFKEMNLANDLGEIIDNGIYIDILQNAASTIKSLDVLFSGLYQFEIPLNLSVGLNKSNKTALGFIARDLGYETNFIYGGSGSWQKIDSYAQASGFSHIFYNTHILEYANKNNLNKPYANSWGAFDHYLYDFVLNTIGTNTKSLNMILSTSYHPPYDAPLEQLGIPLNEISNFINQYPNIKNKARAKKIFSHIYYQNKQIANFIKKARDKFPTALFVITGDHYDREYPLKSDLFITNSIPLIIYSPLLKNIKTNHIAQKAAHIDITPSIIDLIAPKNYEFLSFGDSIFKKSDNERVLGYFVAGNARFLTDGLDFIGDRDEDIGKNYMRDLARAKALSWWIFKHGYSIN